MTTEFTPWSSLIGGVLIGLSAVVLMAGNGRIAGLTRIFGGLLPPLAEDWRWRAVFLAGAVIPPLFAIALGFRVPFDVPAKLPLLAGGGVLVGLGLAFNGGCPSGHGVCGIARLSRRSIAATAIFMATALLTVYCVRHGLGS